MTNRLLTSVAVLGMAGSMPLTAVSQVDYRNIDSGRPVRISDAIPTPRRSAEISLANGRVDKLSMGRYRLQLEPRLAYGIFPRTEIAVRSPVYFNELAYRPRAGVGGVGVGAEHLLKLESHAGPAVAVASELFVPTGAAALPATYSVKALVSRTFPAWRLHFNASYGNYKFRAPAGLEKIIPPIHTPCSLVPVDGDRPIRLFCGAPTSEGAAQTAAQSTDANPIATHGRWLSGLAADHTLPLRSILLVGDVFAQQFQGIERPLDWTAEFGARMQLTHTTVLDAGVGRLFTGESHASYFTLGTTISHPFKL